ncbi:hypothetical protein SKAU_G00130130 [Synaphobranchus kaupii]|uniref:Uncharacterized protein n=1 Tax=Synaphobranchus kaupii TaxID=118154 RepID=A0A9Q1FR80_SYNKA|nr:hypothetical protein SKAU_G00130130 [Synaphobranchus kaupii]
MKFVHFDQNSKCYVTCKLNTDVGHNGSEPFQARPGCPLSDDATEGAGAPGYSRGRPPRQTRAGAAQGADRLQGSSVHSRAPAVFVCSPWRVDRDKERPQPGDGRSGMLERAASIHKCNRPVRIHKGLLKWGGKELGEELKGHGSLSGALRPTWRSEESPVADPSSSAASPLRALNAPQRAAARRALRVLSPGFNWAFCSLGAAFPPSLSVVLFPR